LAISKFPFFLFFKLINISNGQEVPTFKKLPIQKSQSIVLSSTLFSSFQFCRFSISWIIPAPVYTGARLSRLQLSSAGVRE
jgi:hypothetical protein